MCSDCAPETSFYRAGSICDGMTCQDCGDPIRPGEMIAELPDAGFGDEYIHERCAERLMAAELEDQPDLSPAGWFEK